MTNSESPPKDLFEAEDSVKGVMLYYEMALERGWTDGLPVYPPTVAAVDVMLQGTRRDPEEVVGIIPPRNGPATVRKIAINAVMTGCRPEYMPVLIAAVECMVQPEYNLYGRQTTTHPGAHLLIVHGPIRKELEVQCTFNVLGHGSRANATMGRALRLILINIGGNKPGVTDMATHGHPGRYSYCMGEDEENSPWTPLHVDRGYGADQNAVTVVCAEAPHNINDMVSKTPELYLGSAASAMSHLGANGVYRGGLKGEQFLLLTSEGAQWLQSLGWSKGHVQKFLFEQARQPIRLLRDRGGWKTGPIPSWIDENDDDAMVPIVDRPEDIILLVAGGFGRHMNAILTSAYNMSATRPVEL
ncbi:MAG: hypothetical protein ACREML_03905 [Vulcanimicrobiaceae bacterium]